MDIARVFFWFVGDRISFLHLVRDKERFYNIKMSSFERKNALEKESWLQLNALKAIS